MLTTALEPLCLTASFYRFLLLRNAEIFVWVSWRPASCGLRGSRGFVVHVAGFVVVGFVVVGFVVVGFVVMGFVVVGFVVVDFVVVSFAVVHGLHCGGLRCGGLCCGRLLLFGVVGCCCLV